MWKSRYDLPAITRLPQFQFDPVRLRDDFLRMTENKKFDGLSVEYEGLCATHHELPQHFLRPDEPMDDGGYCQLALSEWDENYSLEQRTELSQSKWDRLHPKHTKRADERFYRKPVSDIPPYLTSVLERFRPYLHRCRFAKLKAGREVLPHIDYDTTYGIRLHIAIQTNDRCVNGAVRKDNSKIEEHVPADGSVWFINQGLRHWAKNHGDTERVHLIMSLDTQSFLRDLA
jgi:hypothetical protein